jgi:hypothetical protein
MRRRLRRQQRAREGLLLDLGALVFELHRQGRREPELLQAKAAELTAVDEEVRALTEALGGESSAPQLGPPVAESCGSCGALLASDARFCSSCGTPVEQAAAAGEPEAPMMEAQAVEAEPVEAEPVEAEPLEEAPVEKAPAEPPPVPEEESPAVEEAQAPGPDIDEGIVSVSPMTSGQEEALAEPTPDPEPEPEIEFAAEPDAYAEPAEVGLEDFGGEEPAADATPPGSEEHAAPDPAPPAKPEDENLVEEAQRLARIARRRAREWLDRQRS